MPQRQLPLADLGPAGQNRRCVDLSAVAGRALTRLPFTLRILLEDAVVAASRNDHAAAAARILARANGDRAGGEIAFRPGRILMHDTTCVPALVDVAALRDAVAARGFDPRALNPVVPIHALIDHSVAVDRHGRPDAMTFNMRREMDRNRERYRFLKWAGSTLDNLTVFPPGTGILHTVNMEWLATVVAPDRTVPGLLRPDTLIGTDSHTPMINALGMLGWGVGGLEAEMAMFGLPLTLALPRVVGVRLTGALRPGVLATDLALVVTERLRGHGVVGCFVEFFGPGVSGLPVGARAAVANMAPEYGATTGFFPVDERTLDYLRATGRDAAAIATIEAFARRQGHWRHDDDAPDYDDVLTIDLAAIDTTLSGPRRPQDRRGPAEVAAWATGLPEAGADLPRAAVAIAAITSCTNSADPRLLVTAGLLARNARRFGLRPPAWVKTSFAPGSAVAVRYLERAGLLADLAALGFDVVGIGCTTCIGNSGPLAAAADAAVRDGGARVVAVLSGNRNFPRRVHPLIDDAFLCSPPLVVACALAGSLEGDIRSRPLGSRADGGPVRLADVWPDEAEIDAVLAACIDPADGAASYTDLGDTAWRTLEAPSGVRFPWDRQSSYLRSPPFLERSGLGDGTLAAHPLAVFGDDMTTDHISPAGMIPPDGSAGRHLAAAGCDPADLNVFAARRGNFEVMVRGAFTNAAAVNLLCPEAPRGHTVTVLDAGATPLFEAAARMRQAGHRLVLVAGQRYGSGSSRDWAAKAPALLGVEAVLAGSFERIHRSNLIGMGILPVELPAGTGPQTLSLRPADRIELALDWDAIAAGGPVAVTVRRGDGGVATFAGRALVETAQDLVLLRSGGVLPFMLEHVTSGEHQRRAL